MDPRRARRPVLHPRPVYQLVLPDEHGDRQENIQTTFVWRYRPPFGTLQFAYQRGTAEFGERSDEGNTFFTKATAVF